MPQTGSEDRLLVSSSDAVRPLRLVDLTAGETVTISGIPGGGLQDGAFLDDGSVAFKAGDRSIGFLDPSGARQPDLALPASLPGRIQRLSTLDGSVWVSTVIGEIGERRRKGLTAILEPGGPLRCAGPPETHYFWEGAGYLWSEDLRSRMDPATCTTGKGLELAGYEGPLFFLTDRSSAYMSVDGYTISRFDLSTGQLLETSPEQTEPVADALLLGDEVWMLTGAELTRLDAGSMEPKSSKVLLECGYSPSFAEAGEDVFLIDDCNGVLYRLSEEASLLEGWRLPLDEGSDILLHTVSTGAGLWLVDTEQSGEPYFFSFHRRRFEQLPAAVKEGAQIYALVFDVGTDNRD